MPPKEIEAFPAEIIEILKNYVYRLIDPRNGDTFYVGRGVGNRLYAHIHDELGSETDEVSDKLRRIREIRLSGFEVAHVIHRHGMDLATAKEVEAALIDAYPGLTNIMGGEGSGERGAMHANEIIREYSAEPAIFNHRILLISINRSASERPLYEATRYAWKLSQKRAKETEIVLASEKGIIKAAYIPEKWLEATAQNFPGRPDRPGRLGFIGREADEEIKKMYLGRRIPEAFRFGTANPIRYTWN
ncbi:LEM-3-like GIY-YIG domain-containing protein [Pseudomonas sp. TTU2014-080ASC]|uniref:LEM-3-like GIY-YIG domain-containing protein n=1 Tax=Pseudomonas sp. TTU2014-080ASC TaxID=1729724 RepID=UPI00071838B2|nr:hypothetical protein [Pseudomonas sp. TTU2014-080ASC]KRW58934.1 hypothetical protein AO726_15600 [Pseudomonas sp. TTU2014-080ASC]